MGTGRFFLLIDNARKINYNIMVMNMAKRESKIHESFKFASRNISIGKNFRTP